MEKLMRNRKKNNETKKNDKSTIITATPEKYNWTWTRIQLLSIPASPPASSLTSMVIHPVESNIIYIFGGCLYSSANRKKITNKFG